MADRVRADRREAGKAVEWLAAASESLLEAIRTGNTERQAEALSSTSSKLGVAGVYALARCLADAWCQWSSAESVVLELVLDAPGDPREGLGSLNLMGIDPTGRTGTLDELNMDPSNIAAARFILAHLRDEGPLTQQIFLQEEPGYPQVTAALVHMCAGLKPQTPWRPDRMRMT